MKIFWEENKLWNKSINIIKLYENKILIPETIILEKKEINNFNINLLKVNQKYILRPSFNIEDWSYKSYAWFFQSIIFKNKMDIKNFLIKNKNNLEKIFWWKKYQLNSLIIQDFIKTNIYWVYFTRNPNNIFEKWFYEIWKNNNEITSWNIDSDLKLNFLQKKELEIIWKKIEKIFKYPQDIEFCIKNWKIILLQTRNITTWNNSLYNFYEIEKFNWIYSILDFDELWEKQDFFSYKVLNKLFSCIYINSRIYFKSTIIPYYLFKKINKTQKNNISSKNLYLFYQNYKKYLFKKMFFNFIKLFIFQKLDKNILKIIFKNYKYSFLIKNKSNLDLNFKYENINFITKYFLKIEKQKNISFKYLEKYKKEYIERHRLQTKINNNYQNNKLSKKIILLNWIILNNKKNKEKYNWIYKWKINWIITDLNNFKYKKNLNQILIIENLNIDLYDKIGYINWVIIKKWNSLSHNSIILREYKISSIIKYKDYDKLKVWENIIL